MEGEIVNVDDVVETANHFRCIDMIIDNARTPLSEKLIKELHFMLKNGTSDSRKSWFAIGGYKKKPNVVGGMETVIPEEVGEKIKSILIDDSLKMFYYRGLKEWDNEKGYLRDACLTEQDSYKAYLDYFRINY